MRMFLKVKFGLQEFNAAVKDGSVGEKMNQILADAKPEAAYFIEENGYRTGILIINMKDTSEIPKFAEPWFLTFNAQVEIHPVMLPEDLAKAGLDDLGKKWG